MKIILAIILFVIPNKIFAEDLYSKKFSECIEASASNDLEMAECSRQEYEVQDKKLNDVYKTLMLQLDDDRKSKLKDAQRAWLVFRDKNCDFYHNPDGGTLGILIEADCKTSLTANRVNELEKFANSYSQ